MPKKNMKGKLNTTENNNLKNSASTTFKDSENYNYSDNKDNSLNKFIDFSDDFNDYMIFDVFLYRELFMQLRKQMDELSMQRNKGDKEVAEYDEAVYNITSNAITDCGAQDFIGFCYKKGYYDFCILNYEKYMKWTILAAANGNAFSVSKLQVYLTTAIDKIMEIDDQKVLVDFLDLTADNYLTLLAKMVCSEIVKILNISAESLIKMPEKYMEQNEEIQKIFDKAKLQAADIVCEKIKSSIDSLNKQYEKKIKQEEKLLIAEEKIENNLINDKNNELNLKVQENNTDIKNTENNKFKRNLKIKKKFRY